MPRDTETAAPELGAPLEHLDLVLLILNGTEPPASMTPEERQTFRVRLRLIQDAAERLLHLV